MSRHEAAIEWCRLTPDLDHRTSSSAANSVGTAVVIELACD